MFKLSIPIGPTPDLGVVREIFYQLLQRYVEDITRWREHMKFIYEWKNCFTSERSIDISVSKIKKSRRKTTEKQRNDVSDIFTSEDMVNISLVSRI